MPAIPWSAALYMFKKLMPVVIDQAPELLKTFERRRAASREETSDSTAALMSVNERLDAQYDLLKAQSDIILQLQATLASTRRSLTRAWITVGISLAFSVGALIVWLTRP